MSMIDVEDAYLFETGSLESMAKALEAEGMTSIRMVNGQPEVEGWFLPFDRFRPFEIKVMPSGLERAVMNTTSLSQLLERYYALIYPNRCETREEHKVISAFTHALCEDYSEIAIADFFDGWAANHRRWPTWFETKRELDARMELIRSVCDQIRSQIVEEVAANDDA